MSKKTRHNTNLESADALARLFDQFDFQVEPDDFVLYELGRLIEEDRASFEDEEFRRIIDLGIHAHIESRIDVRAQLAAILRRSRDRNAVKTINALENIDSTLRNLSLIVRTYTGYIFHRLQAVADQSTTLESEAQALIHAWQKSENSP